MAPNVDFLGRDVVSARDFKREQFEKVLRAVDDLEGNRGSLDGALKGMDEKRIYYGT